MNKEIKQCQNCKNQFTIEPEDFEFYKKIDVPPPTWCPECRLIRRLVFRNQRTLYRRHIKGYKDRIFSVYPESSGFNVHYQKNWLGAEYDAVEFGRDYDFSRSFFVQLHELMLTAPWQHIYNQNALESTYCSNAIDLKNCYLMFNSGYSENCMYGSDVLKSSDSLDTAHVANCQSSYDLFHSEKCNRCFFSSDLGECTNVYFSYDLINCHNCVGCVGLRHKQHCIFNTQYSKEDYFEKLKEFNFGSYSFIETIKERLKEYKLKYPMRYMHGYHNVNVTGDYLNNSKNARSCFVSRDIEDCAYCQLFLFVPGKDCYDMTIAGGERSYEVSIGGGYRVGFSWLVVPGRNSADVQYSQYSMNCFNCSDIFGCVSLYNKKYCILNKQYTEEEYKAMVSKITVHMNEMPYIDERRRVYKYGEFFPPEFSPYGYNETLSQELFPLSKQEALSQGYKWKDREGETPDIAITAKSLPDHIREAPDSIIKEVIGCIHKGQCNDQCTVGFKILPKELAFYQQMNIPLPRLCHNCRHFTRISQRNPPKLWHRPCNCAGQKSDDGIYQNNVKHFHGENHCPNEFETSYAPDRKEIIYCEQCYQSEVV